MFYLSRPSPSQIRQLLDHQAHLPFSYPTVGMTNGPAPAGYTVDHNRILLGYGEAVYRQAVAAVQRWEMFNLGWVELCWPDTPIEPGSTVGILARLPGVWSLSACRVVHVIESEGEVEKYGFAYGTPPQHVARGEERFLIEWHHADDSVWYDILAYSQPNGLLFWLGYPVSRLLQQRFARGSKAAMQRACQVAASARASVDQSHPH